MTELFPLIIAEIPHAILIGPMIFVSPFLDFVRICESTGSLRVQLDSGTLCLENDFLLIRRYDF